MKRLWSLLCLLLLLLGCGGQAADGTITYVPSQGVYDGGYEVVKLAVNGRGIY